MVNIVNSIVNRKNIETGHIIMNENSFFFVLMNYFFYMHKKPKN